jgi:hypothetical protein
LNLATELECDRLVNGLVREPISAGRIGALSAVGADRGDVHAGGAILLHELDTPTATRGTTNDGVNDPVRAAWGQAQGTAAGSFTPSLVQ